MSFLPPARNRPENLFFRKCSQCRRERGVFVSGYVRKKVVFTPFNFKRFCKSVVITVLLLTLGCYAVYTRSENPIQVKIIKIKLKKMRFCNKVDGKFVYNTQINQLFYIKQTLFLINAEWTSCHRFSVSNATGFLVGANLRIFRATIINCAQFHIFRITAFAPKFSQ